MNFINNVMCNEIAQLDILMYLLITKVVESHLENFKKRRKEKSGCMNSIRLSHRCREQMAGYQKGGGLGVGKIGEGD